MVKGDEPLHQHEGVGEAEIFMRRLRKLREKLNLSRYQVAKRAGLTSTQVKDFEEGRNKNPELRTIEKFAAALRVSPYDLLRDRGESAFLESSPPGGRVVEIETVTSRAYQGPGRQSAGREHFRLKHPDPEECFFIIRFYDDSMLPEICPGDLLLIDKAVSVADGQIGFVSVSGRRTVRTIWRLKGGRILLKPDNPAHRQEVFASGEVEFLGQVVEIVERKLTRQVPIRRFG